jgi:hypothetical protein
MTADEDAARARSEAKREVQRLREEITATVDAIEYKLDVKRQASEFADQAKSTSSEIARKVKAEAQTAQFRAKRFAEEDPVLLGVIGAAAAALVGGVVWAALAARR